MSTVSSNAADGSLRGHSPGGGGAQEGDRFLNQASGINITAEDRQVRLIPAGSWFGC